MLGLHIQTFARGVEIAPLHLTLTPNPNLYTFCVQIKMRDKHCHIYIYNRQISLFSVSAVTMDFKFLSALNVYKKYILILSVQSS